MHEVVRQLFAGKLAHQPEVETQTAQLQARHLVQRQDETISNSQWRYAFLINVPVNRTLGQLIAASQARTPA